MTVSLNYNYTPANHPPPRPFNSLASSPCRGHSATSGTLTADPMPHSHIDIRISYSTMKVSTSSYSSTSLSMAGVPSGAASPDLRSEAGFAARRRKRTFSGHRRSGGGCCLVSPPFAAAAEPPAMTGLRFLLQKELRNSDVGSLGRVVLPKKESEANLPILTAREGISLPMTDSETARVWRFKFRFWPNNKSRMYILENTGEFVRSHGLKSGDFIMLYKDDGKDRYVIRAKKAGTPEEPVLASLPVMEDGIFDSIVADIVVARARYSDLYLPLADGMNMAFGLNCAFSADLVMSFADDKTENNSAESAHKLGSMESLSLDDLF